MKPRSVFPLHAADRVRVSRKTDGVRVSRKTLEEVR